jgi:NAD(P)-dependent dehydrogenase (short-subunit alcohol dehydrogenase family)
VVAVDIVEALLQAMVADLREQGATITGCTANVASDTDVASMLATATSTYGRLDILCNNAGIMDLMTPAAEVPLDLWERVLAVNLTGPFLACRRAIPLFLEQGGGSIVNTASEAGLRGGAAGTAYTVLPLHAALQEVNTQAKETEDYEYTRSDYIRKSSIQPV